MKLWSLKLFAFLSVFLSGAAYAQTSIRVVALPIANDVSLLIARDKGFFAEEKLDVTWSTVTQSAIAIEAVYSGSAQFGGGGVLEPLIARGNGLDLMLAVPTAKVPKAPPENSALVVRADSAINSAADLVGKKVSVGLINSINYVHMVEWLSRRGVDAKKVEFLEMPFPQMSDALLQKRLDMVWAVEPFLTLLTRSGQVRTFAYPYSDNIPGMDLTAFFARERWIKANPAAARGFRNAILKATRYFLSIPRAEKDQWVAKYTGMKPELVAQVRLPELSLEFDEDSLRQNFGLAVKQRLSKQIDVSAAIWAR